VRSLTTRIRNDSTHLQFVLAIVGLVGLNGIVALVGVGHGEPKGSLGDVGKMRDTGLEPEDMSLGLMDFASAIAMLIFFAEPPPQLHKPEVIGATLPNPQGTRVVRMGLAIGSQRKLGSHNVVGGIQKLRCLKNHLHDVFVAVKTRRSTRTAREDEDVHGGREGLSWRDTIRFLEFIESGQHTEAQRELVLCVEKHREESIRGLKCELRRRECPSTDETAMNENEGVATLVTRE
jgi:hypothetical protein